MKRLCILVRVVGLSACAAPGGPRPEPDGGIGGTGAPAVVARTTADATFPTL